MRGAFSHAVSLGSCVPGCHFPLQPREIIRSWSSAGRMHGFWSCAAASTVIIERGQKRKRGKERKKKKKKRKKIANPPNEQTNKKQPSSISNLAWPNCQIENLGQNTGDLPPRTIADYPVLRFAKIKLGEQTSRKCKWGLSCSEAQRATISEQEGFCSPRGDAVWQDEFIAVHITAERKGPGGSHLGLAARKLYHRYSCRWLLLIIIDNIYIACFN